MPYVPVTERSQAMTTGINGQLEIARTSSGPFKEFDIKNCRRTRNFNNQDKTGSHARGYGNSEVGHITFTFTFTLINHVDDPIDFEDPNNTYYAKITIHGSGTFEGYIQADSKDDGVNPAADHDVSVTARGCIRKEGSNYKYPTWTKYVPE